MHFVNAHCINVAAGNPAYLQILQQAAAVYPDGSGIRKAGDMLGTPIIDNVNGTDMFPLLCRRFAKAGKKMFLLGAEPGIAEKTARWAQAHADAGAEAGPSAEADTSAGIIAGYHDGFFSEDAAGEVVARINAAAPDLLLTAMGVPRQELWLHEHLAELDVPVCMGVGGLFDFYSGKIHRAPLWMRKVGIEWVWRLLMEPRRMWKRYIIGNVRFLLRIRSIQKHQNFPRNQA